MILKCLGDAHVSSEDDGWFGLPTSSRRNRSLNSLGRLCREVKRHTAQENTPFTTKIHCFQHDPFYGDTLQPGVCFGISLVTGSDVCLTPRVTVSDKIIPLFAKIVL